MTMSEYLTTDTGPADAIWGPGVASESSRAVGHPPGRGPESAGAGTGRPGAR